jgi:hypothetical protein
MGAIAPRRGLCLQGRATRQAEPQPPKYLFHHVTFFRLSERKDKNFSAFFQKNVDFDRR